MADLIASTLGPRIRVSVDIDAALPAARADANQLEMAMLNLAVNARDAMPDGGQLVISAKA
jgi:signal transduction histidine kinase